MYGAYIPRIKIKLILLIHMSFATNQFSKQIINRRIREPHSPSTNDQDHRRKDLVPVPRRLQKLGPNSHRRSRARLVHRAHSTSPVCPEARIVRLQTLARHVRIFGVGPGPRGRTASSLTMRFAVSSRGPYVHASYVPGPGWRPNAGLS